MMISIMKEGSNRFKGLTIGSTLFFLTAGGSSQAAPLNLTLIDDPAIVSKLIDVEYVEVTDSFTAKGFAMELDDDGIGAPEIIVADPFNFNLSATIDEEGQLASGGLTIGGNVPTLGFNSETVLTGALTAFGFPSGANDPTLEFLFSVTGGDAAALYGGVGATGGIILTGTNFDGGFDDKFNNNGGFTGKGEASATTAPVPLPAAVWLFGSLLVGLTGIGRRRIREGLRKR